MWLPFAGRTPTRRAHVFVWPDLIRTHRGRYHGTSISSLLSPAAGSNRLPCPYHGHALPVELAGQLHFSDTQAIIMIISVKAGAPGLEPGTSWAKTTRSAGLSYTPMIHRSLDQTGIILRHGEQRTEPPTGLEPITCCLQGSCSASMSYGGRHRPGGWD